MITIALKNRSAHPAILTLFGEDKPLPEGAEYDKFHTTISILVSTTIEDKSQEEEYERITKTPLDLLKWMRRNFQLKELSFFRIKGYRLDESGKTTLFLCFKRQGADNIRTSKSTIHIGDKTFCPSEFFQEEQIQTGIIDVLFGSPTNKRTSQEVWLERKKANQLYITVAPGELMKVVLGYSDMIKTLKMENFMPSPNPSNPLNK